MPLDSALVGSSTDPITHSIDSRWTMAFAAAVGDHLPAYLDTRRPEDLVAHPMFAPCVEWPAVLDARHLTPREVLPAAEAARGLHATHDLTIHRLVRPGDVLTTVAHLVAVERRTPGAYEVLRLETVDATGANVATTYMGSLFLGVEVRGDDVPLRAQQPVPAPDKLTGPRIATTFVDVDANAAHVYSECARIWNPIHTDIAVAEAAGLPAPILHGTALLASAVSKIIELTAGGDPSRVARVSCRFSAMVMMPSTITIRIFRLSRLGRDPSAPMAVFFQVGNQKGEAAIRDGVVVLTPPTRRP